MPPTIGLIIPTLNAQQHFANSPYLSDIISRYPTLIIDSSSTDLTVATAERLGATVLTIPKASFNHGATRELARQALNTDIVVFLTQDAIPHHADLIEQLVAPLLQDETIAVTYGRQIPHSNADVFEAFPRTYNYGVEPQVRGLDDAAHYGVYTFFCSNSCAAWRSSALNMMGGFKAVLTNEDYFTVAELLVHGYKVAYVPSAIVRHSHRYTLWQEFQRYFDTGYVRAQNPLIQQLAGQAENRGVGFLMALLKHLWQTQPLLIPYALLQSGVKWLGYRVGFYAKPLPLFIKRRLSQQVGYWDSDNS